jgi:hypothetical protein
MKGIVVACQKAERPKASSLFFSESGYHVVGPAIQDSGDKTVKSKWTVVYRMHVQSVRYSAADLSSLLRSTMTFLYS